MHFGSLSSRGQNKVSGPHISVSTVWPAVGALGRDHSPQRCPSAPPALPQCSLHTPAGAPWFSAVGATWCISRREKRWPRTRPSNQCFWNQALGTENGKYTRKTRKQNRQSPCWADRVRGASASAVVPRRLQTQRAPLGTKHAAIGPRSFQGAGRS